MRTTADFSMELAFTGAYRRAAAAHGALREAACLRAQFPAILTPIKDNDLFAGRIAYRTVGFSPQFWGFGFFCNEQAIVEQIQRGNIRVDQRDAVMDMLLFWRKESTTRKIEAAFDERMVQALGRDKIAQFPFEYEPEIASPLYRMAGIYVDYEKLMRLGVPGLKAEVHALAERAHSDDRDGQLYVAMQDTLDLFVV